MSSGQSESEEDSVLEQSPTKIISPTNEQVEDISIALKKSREDDLQKGQVVKAQLQLWDTLLDTRIRLQKSVVASNRFPVPSLVNDFFQSPDCRNAAMGFLREAYTFIEALDDLQDSLLTSNNITVPPPRKRRKLDSDATLEDYSDALVTATAEAAALEEAVHPYILQTLSKWSSKIQAVAPSTLLSSNRGAFLRGNQHLKSALQLIDENLADRSKLLERTQMVRSKKPRIGRPQQPELETDIFDSEIFDDTDFYQKILRDIIDSRGSGFKNEDWQLFQKRKKSKKTVDTKASKGRKLRFEVHDKIQNFMVPVPVVGAWHDDQIDELFSSLLGKGFEDAVVNPNENQVDDQSIELSGFRVFGWKQSQIKLSTVTSPTKYCFEGQDFLPIQEQGRVELGQHVSIYSLFEAGAVNQVCICQNKHSAFLPTFTMNSMNDFEDENPFEQEGARIPSETSSTSQVALYEPPSPPRPNLTLSPTIHGPNRPPFPSPGSHKLPQANYKTDFCCSSDRFIHSGDDIEILIVDAQKTSVNASSPYIAYVIRTGNAESRHRYSEFESLRENLCKLYPTLIIPPIPSKQSIGDYAVKQGKAKEDTALIARRKRLLQTFLNRLARHPILSNEHIFHRFLDGEVSWNEVLNSPPITLLPKNILKAPSHSPTDQNASPAYAALPNPSAAHPLRQPDQRFMDSEAFTVKFANHVSGPMEKVTRRAIKRWSEYSQDHAELGAALNAFSLNESDTLAGAIEKTGQAVDTTYMSTTKLVQDLEQNWTEPLHEYSQFGSIIKKLLAYRHQKHVQFEMTQDALENKREQLEELEKSEREARRLDEALNRGRITDDLASSNAATSTEGKTQESPTEPSSPISTFLPPHPGPNPARRRTKVPGAGLLNALSYTLHGIMDVDPETARRNGITKTRENISQLEDALHLAAQDLKYSSSTIQADLDRFQRQKVADLREMAISMARSHRDWCKKNLEAWEEAKREIEKIPPHPNRSPEKAAEKPTSNRRDSAATVNGR